MDDRIREHARILVDWSARIDAGDDVVLAVEDGAHDLAVAVAEQLGDRGANLLSTYQSDELTRAYLQAHDGSFTENPEYELALYERADSVLFLKGSRNTTETADVDSDRRQAYSTARQEIREARLDTDWVSTQHPTRAMAQQAGMAYDTYQDFVYDATLRDWEALADEQARLKDILDDGKEVRIVANGTDITLFIDGRIAVNSAASVAYDSHNLPSGEVFTAPYDTAGVVTFDVPMTIQGRRIKNVEMTFKDGVVVDWSAEQGEAVIDEIIGTDSGSRQLGELGIGMNRGVDRITDNILFDEKMGGTVHLALGRAYDACLPKGESGNDSAVHEDLITTMGEGSRLEVDGEVVQKDGVFRWEDGFEG
ncbi:aminopeptidase [Haloarcula sp. NS06]|uniref:aminopeptidase n=1 Tax=unclassified Haloarcula TaxID=2624677 RepID=UPI0027B7AF50|nr:aminopeptidase [Haloarcula sp. H-GB4]MDQ2073397.1 aminopeptidase [Haloarcula sp. H-GB4]